MSIIPKLVALGLAVALSSPGPEHHIDYSPGPPDSGRINQVWLVPTQTRLVWKSWPRQN